MRGNNAETFKKEPEHVSEDADLNTIKKEFHAGDEEISGEIYKEIRKEKKVRYRMEKDRHDREIDNLKGHVKFLYGMLNNVLFTLNQHAVVINKELLPAKHKYLESKVMVKMFENIVSGTESVSLLNLLTKNDQISIFKSSGERQSSLGWLSSHAKSKEKEGKTTPVKVEQNITSNANNVVGTSMGLSSGQKSKQNNSPPKVSDFSGENKGKFKKRSNKSKASKGGNKQRNKRKRTRWEKTSTRN